MSEPSMPSSTYIPQDGPPPTHRYAFTEQEIQQDLRPCLALPTLTPNMPGDDDHESTGPQRRRIAVACARCRRRKIKCTGDPGDGSGCHACKVSNIGTSNCIFHRVGSSIVNFQDGQDMIPRARSNLDIPTLSLSSAPAVLPLEDIHDHYRSIVHRPSLPTMRTSMPMTREAPFYHGIDYRTYSSHALTGSSRHGMNWPPYDQAQCHRTYYDAGYAPTLRHNSIATSPMLDCGQYCETYDRTASTLPVSSIMSAGTSAYSPPMASLHPPGRRLPIPFNSHGDSQLNPVPSAELRPIQSHVSFRPLPIHDRLALPWAYEAQQPRRLSMSSSSTIVEAVEAPAQASTSTILGDPVLGYQFTTNVPVAIPARSAAELTSSTDQTLGMRPTSLARSTTMDLTTTQAQLSLVPASTQQVQRIEAIAHDSVIHPSEHRDAWEGAERYDTQGYNPYGQSYRYHQSRRRQQRQQQHKHDDVSHSYSLGFTSPQ